MLKYGGQSACPISSVGLELHVVQLRVRGINSTYPVLCSSRAHWSCTSKIVEATLRCPCKADQARDRVRICPKCWRLAPSLPLSPARSVRGSTLCPPSSHPKQLNLFRLNKWNHNEATICKHAILRINLGRLNSETAERSLICKSSWNRKLYMVSEC